MRLSAILITLLACVLSISSDGKEVSSLDDRIARIEGDIQPVLQIKGEEIEHYKLGERLKVLGIPGLSVALSGLLPPS